MSPPRRLLSLIFALAFMLMITAGTAHAQGPGGPDNATLGTAITVLWILIASFLVFFMQAGFAMWKAASVGLKTRPIS